MGAAASGVLAQTAAPVKPAADSAVEEVLVTAQFRAEEIQRVPIQVSTVTEAQSQAFGILNIQDVPMLSASVTQGSIITYPQPYIRGIGSDLATAGTEHSVSLYIDGIYQSRNIALGYNLNDIERVEVLKGPQGALYGRNATAGVINVVSKRPAPGPFTGSVEVTGGNFSTFGSRFYGSGGTDRLSASIAFSTRRHAGFYENLINGKDFNSQDDYIVSGRVLYNINDTNRLLWSIEAAEIGPDGGTATNQVGVNNVFASIVPGSKWTSRPFKTYTNADGRNPSLEGERKALFSRTITKATFLRWESEHSGFDTNVLLGVRQLTAKSGADGDSTSLFLVDFGQPKERDYDYSSEIQFVSKNTGPLTWLGGASYYVSDVDVVSLIDLGPTLAPTPISVAHIRTPTTLQAKAAAAYIDGGYKFGEDEKWSIDAGVRFTHEQRSIRGSAKYYVAAQPVLPFVYDPTIAPALEVPADPLTGNRSKEKNFSNTSATGTLSYQLTHDTLGYLRFAQAFKSGTFNQSAPYDPAIQPEKVNSGEVGVKSLFGRLRTNAAAFYYDYKNLQVSQVNPNGGATVVNVPKSKVYGAEFEINGRVTDSFYVNAGATWLHARYTDASNVGGTFPGTLGGAPGNYTTTQLGIPAVDPSGNSMIRAPKFATSLAGIYTVPALAGKLSFSGAVKTTSRVYFDVGNQLSQKAYTTLNGSITYRDANDKWLVRVYGNNLTDEHYFTFISRITFGDFAHYGDPRTYGITLGYNF